MTATPDLDTPLVDLIEARTRRLMAERSRLPEWGDGRRARAAMVEEISKSLDEWNRLTRAGA